MISIRETIVVEGKDDESAVKRAVHCDIIITHGYGISENTFKRIESAALRTGVIVFTDPDFAGEKIRKRISDRIPNCKHAFISKEDARSGEDIGVENATPESILDALSKVKTLKESSEILFEMTDLVTAGLIGGEEAFSRRTKMGKILGIGYCNGKQFLSRLNHYGISREEFVKALEALDRRV